jgi:hypothetical protein
MTCKHDRTNSWWEHDARGIPLARVCDHCKADVLKRYRPDVLNNPGYEADEDIDGDLDWDRGIYPSDFGPEGQL